MGLSRRQFTKEFKLVAVRRLEQGVSIAEVTRALEVNPNVLHRWRREFRHGPGNAFPGNGKPRWSEGRIAELERKIGQQAVEVEFLNQSPTERWIDLLEPGADRRRFRLHGTGYEPADECGAGAKPEAYG